MNIETEICKALQDLFKGLLPGVEVFGNWLPDPDGKALEPYETSRLDITVGGRRYEGYNSPIVEITVNADLANSLDADVTLGETLGAHERLAALLTEWQTSLAAVKRDLTISDATGGTASVPSDTDATERVPPFVPVGLRVDDAGTLSVDRDTKTRNLTHQFTIKGRIS